MFKKIASALLGLWSVTQPVSAATDNMDNATSDRWMIFERFASDGRRLVVLARTENSHMAKLLNDGHATVINCIADANDVSDDGMPQTTDRLHPVEAKIESDAALHSVGAIHAASVTGQGRRQIVLLHRDPFDFDQVLGSLRVPGYTCDASSVADRKALVALITPTPIEKQLEGDRSVISSLEKNGDDGQSSRKTDFWFYGPTSAIDFLVSDLKPHGFSIDHRLSNPTGVVLTREMPVDMNSFRVITPVIAQSAKRFGVEYDGWETFVVNRDAQKKTVH